jgi:hypothetical protein
VLCIAFTHRLPNIEDQAERADYEGKAQTLHCLKLVFDVFSFAVSLHHCTLTQRVVLLGKQGRRKERQKADAREKEGN